ncbi:nucleotidyl transferase AbiEii/AbiGii toxin family protein [Acidobacteria bacterium AH-259-D05]|nr:nucleotidyl transferase AbiEii/AbiGii toxin family protein [Acidobacteria bacterium AH-259-D05]
MTKHAWMLSDFVDLIEATASTRNIRPDIIEKDYYLTIALRALAEQISDYFIFKGGTSLSKGWGILERLSEDLDLLFRRQGVSKGEQCKRMKEAEGVVSGIPGFDLSVKFPNKKIPKRDSHFSYQRKIDTPGAVSNTILVEMGVRGYTDLTERREISSFIYEHLKAHGLNVPAEDLLPFEVECLDIGVTFVEKLFSLHDKFAKDRVANKARDYYDAYRLSMTERVKSLIGTSEYRGIIEEVEGVTKDYFPDCVLPKNSSFADSPALQPKSDDLVAVKVNYAKERDLFFSEPPTIDDILNRFTVIHHKL